MLKRPEWCSGKSSNVVAVAQSLQMPRTLNLHVNSSVYDLEVRYVHPLATTVELKTEMQSYCSNRLMRR